MACFAFDLPEQLLLCRYTQRALTKGNVRPWIFTDCKSSSARAKPRWQHARPYMHFPCRSAQHVRNANRHLKGNVGFQRPTKRPNGNIFPHHRAQRSWRVIWKHAAPAFPPFISNLKHDLHQGGFRFVVFAGGIKNIHNRARLKVE